MNEMPLRKNINRGYMKLVVWQDAKEYYRVTCLCFRGLPFELKKIASQQIAAVDSIHRNIAEGYCRRSLKEYLQFLNIALASIGESVSSLHVYTFSQQIDAEQAEPLDALAYKIENGLIRLISSLQQKQQDGDWQDSFIVRESNAAYGSDPSSPDVLFPHSTIPSFQYSESKTNTKTKRRMK